MGSYKSWLEHSVSKDELAEWVDEDVACRWGAHAAARAWNIMMAGSDGEVQQSRNAKPHELEVKATSKVPGSFAPVANMFHASQALIWIAGPRPTLQERLSHILDIPELIKPLENRTRA
jgi:hypothetical protein